MLEMVEKLEYEIVHIDYWEHDALLKVGDKKYYFQFDESPTIFEALEFFKRDSRFYKEDNDAKNYTKQKTD